MTLTGTFARLSVLNRDNRHSFTDTSCLDAISESLKAARYSRLNHCGFMRVKNHLSVTQI